MTTARKWFTSKNILIMASVVLAGYLLLILSATNIGQKKLEEARQNELHLKVEHYAKLLNTYFELSRHSIEEIAEDKVITTYFANKSSGMSMTYGLRASLFKVKRLLKYPHGIHDNQIFPIFSRLTLMTIDGDKIADTLTDLPFDQENIQLLALHQHNQKIFINATESSIRVRLSNTIYFNDQAIAVLIAEFDNAQIVSLLTSQEYQGSGSYIRLLSDVGNLLIWNSMDSTNSSKNSDSFNLIEKIKNTPFTLEASFEDFSDHDFFTSKWFVFIISLLAIPVFISLYYLFYIERKNSLLHSRVLNSKRQRQALSTHNEQLEKEVKKRKRSEQKLAYQATHDALTGLPNRNFSLQQLNHAISLCERSKKKVLIMYLDLDNFKQVNDTLGHAAGDSLLKETSKRLQDALRKTDTIARLSGDEFMIILPELKDLQQATDIATKILSLFEQPFEMNERVFEVTSSIGLAIFPDDADNAETLLKSADMALYKVKSNGRNSFSFYDPKMNDEVNRKVAINQRLRIAIKQQTLEMYYQPIIDLNTKKIVGAEALMRWTDEELGFVPPDEFIAIAEKNYLIDQIGSFALNSAASQAALWQQITPLQIAINVSSVQFRDCQALLNEIKQVLSNTGLAAEKLDIELTESILINQSDSLCAELKSLREMGVQLSLDDFGTGYSALSYLQRFSFTKLKIDRAFTKNLARNQADQTLVTAIIAMAKALNLTIVAEGIEEQQQMQFLKDLDCEYGQGYLFSRPIPANEFEMLLRQQAKTEK